MNFDLDAILLTALIVLAVFLTIRTIVVIANIHALTVKSGWVKVFRSVHLLFAATAAAVGGAISAVVLR